MLDEICLENVRKLKIEIDWKKKKINYSKLEFFDTPEERRVKKEKNIRSRIIEYIKNKGGSCTLRLSRTIKNKEAKKEREDILKFIGCRYVDAITQQLYSMLQEKVIYRYRLKKNHPFIYSFEPIIQQKLSIQKTGKKIDKIKKTILKYIEKSQPCTFKYAGIKEESQRLRNLLETNNKKTIGRALKELIEEKKISRSRDNEYFPYLYRIRKPEEKKTEKEKVSKIKVNRICRRCGSTMKLNRDEEGLIFLYCLMCSERLYF